MDDMWKVIGIGGGALAMILLAKAAAGEPNGEQPPSAAGEQRSYLIYNDNTLSPSITYAKNVINGKIEFSGTDASTVIQNTIGNGGRKIEFYSGKYLLTSPIKLYSGTTIQGAGKHETGTVLYSHIWNENIILEGLSQQITIRDIRLNNMGVNLSQPIDSLMTLSHLENLLIDESTNVGHVGLNLNGNEDVDLINVSVYNQKMVWRNPYGNVRVYGGFLQGGVDIESQTISFFATTFTEPLHFIGQPQDKCRAVLDGVYWNTPSNGQKNVYNDMTIPLDITIIGGMWYGLNYNSPQIGGVGVTNLTLLGW